MTNLNTTTRSPTDRVLELLEANNRLVDEVRALKRDLHAARAEADRLVVILKALDLATAPATPTSRSG